MKATISADGFLEIIAESDLEHYALKMWWASFYRGGPTTANIPSGIAIMDRQGHWYQDPRRKDGEK